MRLVGVENAEFLIISKHAAILTIIEVLDCDRLVVDLLILAVVTVRVFKLAEVYIENAEGRLADAIAKLAILFNAFKEGGRTIEIVQFRGSFRGLLRGGDRALSFPNIRQSLVVQATRDGCWAHKAEDALLAAYLQLIGFFATASIFLRRVEAVLGLLDLYSSFKVHCYEKKLYFTAVPILFARRKNTPINSNSDLNTSHI